MSEHQGDATNGPGRDVPGREIAGLREDIAQVRAIVRSVADRDVADDLAALRATVDELRTRDVTQTVRDDIAELRRMVAEVAAKDPAAELRSDLAPIEAGLVRVAELLTDPGRTTAVTARIDALEATLAQRFDSLASASQVRDLTGDLRAQLADAVAPFDQGALREAFSRLEQEVTSSGQVAAEAWGEFAGLRARIDALAERDETETASVSTLLDEVREALLDVASGEVVGALWDEFRSARMTLDLLAAREQDGDDGEQLAEMRAELASLHATVVELAEATAAAANAAAVAAVLPEEAETSAEDDDPLDALRDDIGTLGERIGLLLSDVRSVLDTAATEDVVADVPAEPDPAIERIEAEVAAVRSLLEASAVEGVPAEADPAIERIEAEVAAVRSLLEASAVEAASQKPVDRVDPALLTAVAADVGALRQELTRGLVVEPSEALTGTVDELRDEVAIVRDGLGNIADLERAVADVRAELATAAERMASLTLHDDSADEETDAAARAVLDELAALRSGVDEVIGRFDELSSAEPAAAEEPPDDVVQARVADQLASLRDEVVTELDGLRQQLDRVASTSAETRPSAPEVPEVTASVDPETVELLLGEIRAAGGVSDAVIEALRKELKALRRRIVVRAREEILSEEQLEIIADAVARKLAD